MIVLTTTDNPYNPRTDYDLWLQWDQEHGYFTQEYLSRLANPEPDMTEEEEESVYQKAIEEILEANVLGIYTIV